MPGSRCSNSQLQWGREEESTAKLCLIDKLHLNQQNRYCHDNDKSMREVEFGTTNQEFDV